MVQSYHFLMKNIYYEIFFSYGSFNLLNGLFPLFIPECLNISKKMRYFAHSNYYYLVYFKVEFSIKKAAALSFLFLAVTIMMAHVIIPHHHHDGLVFFMATACHDRNCNSHDAQSEDDSCDYPLCHDGIENCELATIYVKFDSDWRLLQLHDCDFKLLPCIFTLFSDDHTPPLDIDIGLPFRQNPYLLSLTEYIFQSYGLRAPPVC